MVALRAHGPARRGRLQARDGATITTDSLVHDAGRAASDYEHATWRNHAKRATITTAQNTINAQYGGRTARLALRHNQCEAFHTKSKQR